MRLTLCCLLLALSTIAVAQSNFSSSRAKSRPVAVRSAQPERPSLFGPYLRGGGSFQPGLGYEPGFTFGGGLDHRFPRFLLLSDLSGDSARKIGINSGFSFRAGAGLYLMKTDFGFGGGARCGKLKTNAYEKGACRPFMGMVYSKPQVRFDAAYYFSGTDRVNRLQGFRTVTLLPMSRRVAFELEFGIYRFNESFGAKKYIGTSFSPGIRYFF